MGWKLLGKLEVDGGGNLLPGKCRRGREVGWWKTCSESREMVVDEKLLLKTIDKIALPSPYSQIQTTVRRASLSTRTQQLLSE